MIALLWGAAASAVTGDLCVAVDVNYADLAGDRWIDNGIDRPARGVEVKVVDTRTRTFWLSESEGCLRNLDIDLAVFSVTVYSRAKVNGVELHSWSGPSDGTRPVSAEYFLLGASAPFSYNLVVSGADQVWRNLLVGTMVFKDQTWKIGQGPTNECCLTGAGDDGTCAIPAYEYQPITGAVQLQAYDTQNEDCCQSRLVKVDGTAHGPGVYTRSASNKKWIIAHELGHVILYKRAGGQEVQSPNAPMQGCNGSHKRDPGEPLFAQHEYGKLTKEFVSVALKEGWADFVAAHTWNDPTTAGCDSQGSNELDWDLNGTTDLGMGWRASHPTAYRTVDGVDVDIDDLAGTIDCDGDPDVGDPEVEGITNPAYAWPPPGTGTIDGRNWLADLEAANDPSGCVAHSNGVKEGNRTTIFDVVRLYWALRTDQGVPANELSDLAVDMCFRTWLPDDGNITSSADQRLPFVRLVLSSVHNQVDDELDAEADHVAH